jgi:hypothetical protein
MFSERLWSGSLGAWTSVEVAATSAMVVITTGTHMCTVVGHASTMPYVEDEARGALFTLVSTQRRRRWWPLRGSGRPWSIVVTASDRRGAQGGTFTVPHITAALPSTRHPMSPRGGASGLLHSGTFHKPLEVTVNLSCLRIVELGESAQNHYRRGDVLARMSEVRLLESAQKHRARHLR